MPQSPSRPFSPSPFLLAALLLTLTVHSAKAEDTPLQISGRYPSLAMMNSEGECGTGAVVPWAGKLWVITYPPHKPKGSDDKLYAIDESLNREIRSESVGGTHACRLIHTESKQLIIGPYFIDEKGAVRTADIKKLTGRLTAIARHLSDPANMVYFVDMEGQIYEVNVHTLEINRLFEKPVPGWHGKGAYTSQGRLVIGNNGENHVGTKKYEWLAKEPPKSPEDAGVLAQWDGKNWEILERHQFTEVTGPGGIAGSPTPDAPIWSIGWDLRSVMLKILDGGQWRTVRLPKADYTYDGKHGWHTEWPRIRNVAQSNQPEKFLMNMHGGWFEFPKTMSAANIGGLKPIGDYAKITGDVTAWRGGLVFGCDDTAKDGFYETKGFDTCNSLIGQSNSNLWFSSWEKLSECGRPAGFGGPWVLDDVAANTPSLPYLFGGYTQRTLHLSHTSAYPINVTIEIDAQGLGKWAEYKKISVPANGYAFHIFPADLDAQWIRLTPDKDASKLTAYFHYGPGGGAVEDRKIFQSLADVSDTGAFTHALMRCEGDNKVTLAFEAVSCATGSLPLAARATEEKSSSDSTVSKVPQFFRVTPDMKFTPLPETDKGAEFLKEKAAIKSQISSDDASIILNEGTNRFRLPRANDLFDKDASWGGSRAVREIVTERSLLNAGGSFFILPRTNSGGVASLKPLCTHNKRIVDYCSWRGLLVMSGTRKDAVKDGHYFAADNGMGLWFGDIDDLWKFGKPIGKGSTWLNSPVKPGVASDPFLMTGYDKKTVQLSHDSAEPVTITLEVDVGDKRWVAYQSITVPPGQTVTHTFPAGYQAHWIRTLANKPCKATATFVYE